MLKRWDVIRGARNGAIFGIATFPLDLLMHYDTHIGGLIRMCQVGGWGCGDQMAALFGMAVGWTIGPAFLVALACSVRNLLVLRRL